MYEEETMEQDIYVEAGVLDYSDNDEISAMEEGFMLGYLEA
ncbi:MAG: hypothetical protein O2779_00665 [Nanoarchaeota archaeon]|nr:hypothetical protein [Nanoarchaeota archaeon]